MNLEEINLEDQDQNQSEGDANTIQGRTSLYSYLVSLKFLPASMASVFFLSEYTFFSISEQN